MTYVGRAEITAAGHRAIGLVLIGAGQVAGLRTPGHVGGDQAGAVELRAGRGHLASSG